MSWPIRTVLMYLCKIHIFHDIVLLLMANSTSGLVGISLPISLLLILAAFCYRPALNFIKHPLEPVARGARNMEASLTGWHNKFMGTLNRLTRPVGKETISNYEYDSEYYSTTGYSTSSSSSSASSARSPRIHRRRTSVSRSSDKVQQWLSGDDSKGDVRNTQLLEQAPNPLKTVWQALSGRKNSTGRLDGEKHESSSVVE